MDSVISEGPRLPDATELLGLLEKQDEVLGLLLEELNVCKTEIASLQSLKQTSGSDGSKEAGVKNGDSCCMQNKEDPHRVMVTHTMEGLNSTLQEDIGRRFAALEQVQLELRECRVKNESLVRDLESCKCELMLEKEASALKQAHIDRLNTLLHEEQSQAAQELSRLNREVSDQKRETDRLKEELLRAEASLTTMKDAESERGALLQDYGKRLSTEAESRKRDNLALSRRISVLMQENAVLRSSIASLRGSRFSSTEQSNLEGLLEDQRNLIATLKEECELIANRLCEQRTAFKKEIKQLKRENKDLTAQIDRFITGN